MKKGDRVFMDTNAIMEAHRVKCWNAITTFFQIETVEECQKCANGNQQRREYVAVDTRAFKETVVVHSVSNVMLASLMSADPAAAVLGQGEKDLISRLFAEQGNWYACTPDKAAAASMFRLNLARRITALETLADLAGMRRLKFRDNFTRRWLHVVQANRDEADKPTEDKLLTRREVAARWKVSIETVKRREQARMLRPVRLEGRIVRYRMSDVARIEEDGCCFG
jgi:hypothetical protein